MKCPMVLKSAALLLAVATCSRTPQPQSTPSASSQSSAAPSIAAAPDTSVPAAPLGSTAAADPDAVRSQEDCPERMIFIPGGKLEFTGPVPGDLDKTPKKQTFNVAPFCIDEFEAPDAYKLRGLVLSYRAVEQSCGKRDSACLRDRRAGGPLTCVTPEQAECYCANILPSIPKRLPTDQEFLFAALGTDGRLFPWGNALYPDGQWGAAPDFCSFEPNEEPKTHICAPWQNRRDRSPFGVIGMATNGGEMTLLSGTPKRHYALRGVSHASQDTDPNSIGLARWPGVVSEPARGGPFLSFRCVISKRAGG